MDKEVILKKSAFGGFNRKEVMEYIGAIQEKLTQTEEKLGEIKVLQEQIHALEDELNEKNAQIDVLNGVVDELETRLAEIEGVDEELEATMANADKSVTDFADAISSVSERMAEAKSNGEKKILNEWLHRISGTLGEIGAALDAIMSAKAETKSVLLNSKSSKTDNGAEEKQTAARRAQIKVKKPTEKGKQTAAEEPTERRTPTIITNDDGEIEFSEDMIAQLREIEKKYRDLINNMPE